VTLRELRVDDAAALLSALSNEAVTKFLMPPPPTVEGFEDFIRRARQQRQAGQYACFAIVLRGTDMPIGLFQVRVLEPAFVTAEWGFAIAAAFWGTGVFMDAARLLVDFVFDVIGAHRLEARAVLKNGRANGALKKIGAVMEGVLRGGLPRNGEYLDQAMWSILREDWAGSGGVSGTRVVFH
jgi:ribosomal-protein-alanine N-acetyltransferase